MSSRGRPTPPFNSPYQQALGSTSLLQSPAYPSPARSDAEPQKYAPEGLGLYSYSQSFPAAASPTATILFPPSPQPTEAWAQLSNGASPLMPEPIVDPWTSGAYDHPVSRSPLPWPHYQASHRSSLSSQREMSVFSGDGSEHAFPLVKLETGTEWATDDDSSPHNTVAPHRLAATSIFPYDRAYSSPAMPRYDILPGSSYEARHTESTERTGATEKSASTRNGGRSSGGSRARHRRNRTAPEEAKFTCDICGRGFIRSYNKKSHMERHNPHREKEHKCVAKGCEMKFERKADLDRHFKSVHDKIKDLLCSKCGNAFSRKDTLRRHEDDGCSKRNQLSDPSLLSHSRPLGTASLGHSHHYPSPRVDLYEPAQSLFGTRPQYNAGGTAFDSRSSPMFRDDGFGSAHGF